jgi:2-polyprenyl-3-methyl-5-hydroxy-6-metoxy-1,4-benzoquinol methylase
MERRMQCKYTKEAIKSILAKEKFEYHRVDLPYGLHTPGQNRSKSLSIIFPDDFHGQSILDIGCGIGYFCFEAEKRNAGRIVGIEPKESRYRQLLLLKDILDSKIEVINCNFDEYKYNDTFDYILLLNVIHHLKEPIQVLRRIARLTRKRFIMEFPTFKDRRYKTDTRMFWGRIYDRLPLIGVGFPTTPGVGQTYIFSPVAIRAILMHHDHLFSSIQMIKSPMKGRTIAICDK